MISKPRPFIPAAEAPDPFQLVTDPSKRSFNGGDVTRLPDEGLDLKYPATENLPEYRRDIPNAALVPSCRCFNASICVAPDGRLVMGYRVEQVNAMSTIAIARVNEGSLSVEENVPIEFPAGEEKGLHWEDPHLAAINGQLLMMVACVKFGAPSICRQRLFLLDHNTFRVLVEIKLPYGRALEGHPEKNWLPFETPEGGLAILYDQRPWQVIEHPSADGLTTPGLLGWRMPGKRLNGRTPPVKLPGGRMYLTFFGGHVKHDYRGARYFMGALVFSADRPYGIVLATPEPLCWGSECSPTLLSARPASGHPCCIYPSGAVIRGEEVLVSCGVNDSYNCFLQYRLTELMAKMSPVNAGGYFA